MSNQAIHTPAFLFLYRGTSCFPLDKVSIKRLPTDKLCKVPYTEWSITYHSHFRPKEVINHISTTMPIIGLANLNVSISEGTETYELAVPKYDGQGGDKVVTSIFFNSTLFPSGLLAVTTSFNAMPIESCAIGLPTEDALANEKALQVAKRTNEDTAIKLYKDFLIPNFNKNLELKSSW